MASVRLRSGFFVSRPKGLRNVDLEKPNTVYIDVAGCIWQVERKHCFEAISIYSLIIVQCFYFKVTRLISVIY